MTSNRLVKIMALTLVLMVVMALVIRSSKNRVNTSEVDNPMPRLGGEALSNDAIAALGLEGDTERDTVATLIGEVKKLRSDVMALTGENESLRADNSKLRDMESAIQARLRMDVEKAINEGSARQKAQLDSHTEKTERRVKRFLASASSRSHRSEIAPNVATTGGATLWVQPLDTHVPVQQGEEKSSGVLDLLGRKQTTSKGKRMSRSSAPLKTKEEVITPFITIPQNATLVGSTALTALIGRVPVGSNVTDPYSFKVIIGKDNLAANGIEIPELSYAVSSGKAVGDWTLGCVRGDLYSITFVFEDGTIRTVPKPADIYEGGTAAQSVKIGEIADRFGNPCVVGKRITNAQTYLAQRVGVTALGAAAEAAAAAETTTNTSVSGAGIGVNTQVTGSTKDYIFGRTLSDSTKEITSWLDQRQGQQFDAIYVAPGQSVAVNVTEQIEIDYDSKGRKTQYAGVNKGVYRALD